LFFFFFSFYLHEIEKLFKTIEAHGIIKYVQEALDLLVKNKKEAWLNVFLINFDLAPLKK